MTLEVSLTRARRRAITVGAIRRLLVVSALLMVGAEIGWAARLPLPFVLLPAGLAGAAWAVLAAWRSAPTRAATARRLDETAGLRDLVSTAIDARASASPLHALIVRDATAAAAAIDPARAYPFHWPIPTQLAIVAVIATQVMVVTWRWTAPDAAVIRRDGMPGLSASSGGSSAPGAPSVASAAPPAPVAEAAVADTATPGSATATAGSRSVMTGTGAGRGSDTGGLTPPASSGATSGSRRVPAPYRDIVERYFTAMRSSGQRHP